MRWGGGEEEKEEGMRWGGGEEEKEERKRTHTHSESMHHPL